ncbi:MAG: hypothetical protein FWE66_03605 [Oscillospiraceae bacterium]|nr:hypothetical protein [Oscillospiraceae bacterium]
MKKTIDKKVYNTDTASALGFAYSGAFGQPDGFEERLFVAKSGQHFIYGVGGEQSKYAEPCIELVTEKQAKHWLKENCPK